MREYFESLWRRVKACIAARNLCTQARLDVIRLRNALESSELQNDAIRKRNAEYADFIDVLKAGTSERLRSAERLLRLIECILVPVEQSQGPMSRYEVLSWLDDYRQHRKENQK